MRGLLLVCKLTLKPLQWNVANFSCLVSYRAALGEAYNADTTFADSMESFGGGQDDPVSVSIGGC